MYTIILAGGIGERLFPLSREYYPKQFIQLNGHSLFQKTYVRALRLSSSENIFVVTNRIHQYLVLNQIKEMGYTIPDKNLLIEPIRRNTLPAITLAMKQIQDESHSDPVVVFPSDHIIEDSITDEIIAAEPAARDNLVVFGTKPMSPNTEYGYIKLGEELNQGYRVDEFKEKPDEETAKIYIQSGYLWNSGISMFSTEIFFRELQMYCPKMYVQFTGQGDIDYTSLKSISIDQGLLEHSYRVVVIPITAKWNDAGTFKTLYADAERDQYGNAGAAEFIEAGNNIVNAPGKHIGLIGVNDLIVVDTTDALLVCDQKDAIRIKELVSRYNKNHDLITKYHRTVYRPWGSYTILEESPQFKIKRVTVNPDQKLSLQMHYHRSEHWVVVRGMAEVECDGETKLMRAGESTFVLSGTLHRLKNPGCIPLEVIEVQLGEHLSEHDIIRFDDIYGRIE
jgi:mannose-1-phosphate guanylyltransferase/mannose-6-phosphate isomerase